MENNKKPILVTGSHRSGSTWLGKMIDLSNDTGYIHEPFNRSSGFSGKLFKYWFTYICSENEDLYKKALQEYLWFNYPFWSNIKTAGSLRDYGRSIRDLSIFSWHKLNHKRPLMKDPISIFSAEWLYRTFNMDVIILIRHPAAFVGSIKKVKWRTGMKNFLEQPLLMRDYLADFEQELNEHKKNSQDYIEEGILLWNMIHNVIYRYQQKHDDWVFIRHEDLSRDPVQKFGEIYEFLNLNYTETIRNKVSNYSTAKDNPGKLKRDSKSNIWSWKNRLSAQEIDRIYEGTQKISSKFYTEQDW